MAAIVKFLQLHFFFIIIIIVVIRSIILETSVLKSGFKREKKNISLKNLLNADKLGRR
jgi:p-aminobenzoyl-glutamate transporter AbgT